MPAADITHLYPPSPANVPADLTTPSSSYRTRVFIVLVSLFVFLAVYSALTVGSAYLSYWCFATLAEPDPPAAYTPPPEYRSGSRTQPTARRTRTSDKPAPGSSSAASPPV